MNILEQHEIAEANHRILNPFTEEKLLLLGEVCRLRPGMRQLDLACGKGEMLCRWAERFGIRGLGVDISTVFVPLARARAAELGVDDRVRFERGDAAEAARAGAGATPYDIVSCIGATWVGGGLVGTLELMRPLTQPDGLVLVGEPFWHGEPPPDAVGSLSIGLDDCTSLVGTMDKVTGAGWELVEMVLADQDSWDRYRAAQWWTVERWLRDNGDHPDAAQMRAFLDDGRRSYLTNGRRLLGWGVFVLRPGAS